MLSARALWALHSLQAHTHIFSIQAWTLKMIIEVHKNLQEAHLQRFCVAS
jgi:hypothetical protein